MPGYGAGGGGGSLPGQSAGIPGMTESSDDEDFDAAGGQSAAQPSPTWLPLLAAAALPTTALLAALFVQLGDSGDAGPGLAGMLGGDESPLDLDATDDSMEPHAAAGGAADDDGDVELDETMSGGEGNDAATADVEGAGQEGGAEEWYHEGDAGEGEAAELYADDEIVDGDGEYGEADAGGEYTEEAGGEGEEMAGLGGDDDLAE